MIWIAAGLASALFSAFSGIINERTHASGNMLASWFRIVSVVVCVPFISFLTLPTAWQFWALVLTSAVIMGISDVVLFNAIKRIGAGPSSRFRRTAVLITFIAWLIVSPSLLLHYVDNPGIGLMILATHILAVVFALRLKKDDHSWDGLKALWLPILASALGPILSKLSFEYTDTIAQGIFSYMFIQSTAVLIGYSLYGLVRGGWRNAKPSLMGMVADGAWKPCILASLAIVMSIALKYYGYSLVENPAYVSVLLLTDTVWLLLYHRLYGLKDKTDIASGMGIVACATALILIQIVFE
jgi:hypothetical protein